MRGRERARGDRLVLCYHAVSEAWPEYYSVTPQALEWQLADLKRRGYTAVTFAAAVAAPPQARVFAATFDDAYRSVLERALPILAAHGAPGTVFACSDMAERGGALALPQRDWTGTPHAGELEGMTWDELARLREAGWEIGSHTRSHPMLTRLDDRALEDELLASRIACEERLGGRCESLAYPFGDFDARVARAAGRAGYRQAATLFGGALADPAALEFPRVAINHHHDRRAFRLKTAPVVRRLRSGRPAAIATAGLMRLRGRGAAPRPTTVER